MQKTITKKMQDQTSKMLKATVDMRDVAYSKGLTDDITNTRQQVAGIQARLDNSNRSMGEISRRNDAMAADFKAIGKTLEESTKAINTNNSNLYWIYKNGLKVHTDDVTKYVAKEFEQITGQTYENLVSNTIIKQLKNYIEETKQASATSRLLARTTINATNSNYELIQQFEKDMNLYLIEFALILLLTMATPSWWKLLTTVATTAIAYIINTRKDNDNHDN